MRNILASLLVIVFVIVIAIPTLLVRGCTIGGGADLKRPRGSVIKVFNHHKDTVEDMRLEEYIKGVVAAEMPANFEEEALRAQAVAARTYVLQRLDRGYSVPEHPRAVVSTNHQFGQAWLGRDDLVERWGLINYYINWNKISKAVNSTKGLVLTHNGHLIDALYHSNAGGKTEDPAFVWGNSVPYLKPVDSQYDDQAPDFKKEIFYSWEELDQMLGTKITEEMDSKKEEELLEILEISPTKRILQIRIGNLVMTGKELRSKLLLPSTKCQITHNSEGIKIITYGKGHGVGMSQYGANGMAKQGLDYQKILQHYYPGTKLMRYQGK